MQTKISIIVPVYNAEKYLDRCIKSIYAQTLSNYEIILVNDGSKDDSLALCRKYAEAPKYNTSHTHSYFADLPVFVYFFSSIFKMN